MCPLSPLVMLQSFTASHATPARPHVATEKHLERLCATRNPVQDYVSRFLKRPHNSRQKA